MKSLFKLTICAGIILVIAVGAYLSYERWIKKEPLPEGVIQANGRIEGDRVTVSSKFPGRIRELLAREGDTVKRGQLLIQLDDPQIQAQVKQAKGSVATIKAQVKAVQLSIDFLKEDVPLSIKIAEDDVALAESMLEEAEASALQAEREAIRHGNLYLKHASSAQAKERAALAQTVSLQKVITSRIALKEAKEKVVHARLGWMKIRERGAELEALKAKFDHAKAVLAEIESVLKDFSIQSPTQGTITTRMIDEGEVVSAGAPLLDLVDLDRLYLKVYVAEHEIGKLRLGLPARIFTDAFPEQPFEAVVKYISSRAEFTPKEVQTQDERVKLTYAVKLYFVDNPDHRLTPGQPADAVIRWKGDVPWTKPRW